MIRSPTLYSITSLTNSTDLALAPVALEGLTREVKGAEFMYAKTITLPFFHSGMVDIPPGGEKKTKNSRKNHMVFWVFSGRVQVKVADTSFSIGRGGMWQVPRGTSSIAFFSSSLPCATKPFSLVSGSARWWASSRKLHVTEPKSAFHLTGVWALDKLVRPRVEENRTVPNGLFFALSLACSLFP